jgi:paraquat-inducible protein B
LSAPTPAEPHVTPARRRRLPSLSFVWFVPILALAVSLAIAWQSFADRGVLIEIAFESASGVVADKTELKYRDVTVGVVEQVAFSSDLTHVVVGVRVAKNVAPFLDEDANFWVVRPEVSTQGISGLNTVLSGVYIEGRWNSEAGEARTEFQGLDREPLADGTRPGTAILLRAKEGNSIVAGAPILYKGIKVGAVEAPELARGGDSVVIRGFVEAPYNQILTRNSRFWDISGISVSVGAGGVSLDFTSVASLVQGGISFDTLVAGGEPARSGQTFTLYAGPEEARASLLEDPSASRLRVLAVFDGSVAGLTEGAQVRFRGAPVGEVTSVGLVAETEGNRRVVRLQAVLSLRPGRLGLDDPDPVESMDFLGDLVAQGLRAQLSTASILSSDLVVNLAEMPEAAPAALVSEGDSLPRLPTVPAEMADLNATAEGVFERINNLPVEELMAALQGLIESANALVASDDTRQVPAELNATLAELRSLAPGLEKTLTEAQGTLSQTRLIVEDLRASGATENINNVLTSAASAADAVETAAGELPKITGRVNGLVGKAETVINAYGDSSRLITGALATLRDISEAADAMRTLARTLQRNPNSLILGR